MIVFGGIILRSMFAHIFVGFLLCMSIPAASAKVRHYRWTVTYELKAPDCYTKGVITINGRSPGPTIRAQQGDTIVVELKNGLMTENTAIHWHGIRQIGTPWSDGTEGITQCPILPGDTFVYKFVVDRPGTYIYHAHYGMQRSSGLYGSIQVSLPDGVQEPFAYDYDRSIILNDWWHRSAQELAAGLSAIKFVWVGEPQSILINGRGWYDCSLSANSACNNTDPQCSPSVITVVPGKTYRLRISSVSSLSAFNFEIEGHNMTIIEADGHYVEPFVVKNLNIYSGETYSVLVVADQDPSKNYWAAVNVVSRPTKNLRGLAIFNYYPTHPRLLPTAAPPAGPLWNDTKYRLNQSLEIKSHRNFTIPPPLSTEKLITLLNTQNKIEGRFRWAVNNVSFVLPHTPYLIALKHNLRHVFSQEAPPESYSVGKYDIFSKAENPNATESEALYKLEFNSTVDIVLQNANTMTANNSETHPWHLHGHDFWVLGFGEGVFDLAKDIGNLNLVDPIMKNTVPVHPYGWTAIRFVADNPGVWAFHCHIESHFYMGMGIVFESGVDRVGRLPRSIYGCGESARLRKP
ncbi:cupredoxin superfamily protein [Wolffia australiana]